MERLSDKRLRLVCEACMPNIDGSAEMLAMMAREIQERRAADLTAEEVELLRVTLSSKRTAIPIGAYDVLEKILAAHGAKP